MSHPKNAIVLAGLLALLLTFGARAAEHPSLAMTPAGVEAIRAELGNIPIFDESLERIRAIVDAEIALGIDVPIPKDFSGGYTHQRHKKNFQVMQQAGMLFQVLQEEQYALFIRDMLFEYEAMYRDLPLHPQERSYARGKIFWQSLNDANWLLYASQAYDAIYSWLSPEERQQLEANLFRPFADFLSVENPQFFNRVHNHSTWGTAAVGMIGLVMGDDELVNRALYGLEVDDLEAGAKDDDGGYIMVEGQRAGFLANLDEPFSPDGYYTEGPYYQRYAMHPFLVFAQALHNNKPELDIFAYKDGVLLKAVNALINLSDADGEFFPLNDAQKGMSYRAGSVVTAVDIAYHVGGNDPQLLSIAEQQGQVLIDDSGFSVARDLRDGKAEAFIKGTLNLRDGSAGDEGGVAILRSADTEVVFKYAAQGLSHGHYDKLSYSLYNQGAEVLQDYGLVRFVNVEQKGGGNYLPENTSWAKQTIAHNTLSINETAHFQGSYDIGSQHHSELHFFDVTNPEVQVVSAIETNAYPASPMRRTLALITRPEFEQPILLDVLKVTSADANQYDLPFHFLGQLIDTNIALETSRPLQALGEASGYQHLYLEAAGNAAGENASVTWLKDGRYHSLTTTTRADDELIFARLGANDPDFNLRRDPAFMVRRQGVSDTVFATVLESHGGYNPVTEYSANASSSVASLVIALDNDDHTAVIIEDQGGTRHLFIVAADPSPSKTHTVELAGNSVEWTGPFYAGFLDPLEAE